MLHKSLLLAALVTHELPSVVGIRQPDVYERTASTSACECPPETRDSTRAYRKICSVLPLKYQHLPLGQISPNGWLANQLQIQANGLAGHQHDFYD
jgi:hypothetical protein